MLINKPNRLCNTLLDGMTRDTLVAKPHSREAPHSGVVFRRKENESLRVQLCRHVPWVHVHDGASLRICATSIL